MAFKVSPVEDARLDLNCGQVEDQKLMAQKCSKFRGKKDQKS